MLLRGIRRSGRLTRTRTLSHLPSSTSPSRNFWSASTDKQTGPRHGERAKNEQEPALLPAHSNNTSSHPSPSAFCAPLARHLAHPSSSTSVLPTSAIDIARPIPNSYWATHKLLACEYPWSPAEGISAPKLRALLRAGVRAFVDLTEPGELAPYTSMLPSYHHPISYSQFPIPDRRAPPTLASILPLLSHLHALSQQNVITALHCRGGVGRTGLVVACYYIFLLRSSPHSSSPSTPARARNLDTNINLERPQEESKPNTPPNSNSNSTYSNSHFRASLTADSESWTHVEEAVLAAVARGWAEMAKSKLNSGWCSPETGEQEEFVRTFARARATAS